MLSGHKSKNPSNDHDLKGTFYLQTCFTYSTHVVLVEDNVAFIDSSVYFHSSLYKTKKPFFGSDGKEEQFLAPQKNLSLKSTSKNNFC